MTSVLTITVNDSTMGSVLPTSISTSAANKDGYSTVSNGAVVTTMTDAAVTITATPKTGYEFSHWLFSSTQMVDGTTYYWENGYTLTAVFVEGGGDSESGH